DVQRIASRTHGRPDAQDRRDQHRDGCVRRRDSECGGGQRTVVLGTSARVVGVPAITGALWLAGRVNGRWTWTGPGPNDARQQRHDRGIDVARDATEKADLETRNRPAISQSRGRQNERTVVLTPVLPESPRESIPARRRLARASKSAIVSLLLLLPTQY